jgi:hypothetical protein
VSFDLDFSALEAGLSAYEDRLIAGVVAILKRWGETVEGEARSNKRWQRRSGAAEDGLTAGVIEEAAGQIVTLYLAHQAPHGWYLETEPGTRDQSPPGVRGLFAVIMPTLESHYEDIMNDIREFLR